MIPNLIITHPGSAHFDEVMAVSLLLAHFPETEFTIERRDPTAAELDDPQIWVIDTGNRLEPYKHNFDHHQSMDCPAAFVLIADFLGLSESLSILPWWYFKDSVDRTGPVRASAQFGAGDDLVNRNPVEDWLVDHFSKNPQTALPVLKSCGTHTIRNARGLKDQIDFWKKARKLEIAGVSALIGETRESFGLEEFRRLEKNPPAIIISLDRRSEGWRLYRYDGTPVDFYRLVNSPEIEFAHKSGFMAKTCERLEVDDLIKLVARAVIPT